jgi:hypothetical protein
VPRQTDGLANVLIALCELEKSAILSDLTRGRIRTLKQQIELELAEAREDSPMEAA